MAQPDSGFARTFLKQCPTGSVAVARAAAYAATEAFWNTYSSGCTPERTVSLRALFPQAQEMAALDGDLAHRARRLGAELAVYDAVTTAGYLIGCLYTALLPADYRATYGVYYTPPALTQRLLDSVEACGVDWATARVLDPACGGGAFLGPVAARMRQACAGEAAAAVIDHLSRSLRGFEIDPFSAWLSQVFLDAVLLNACATAGVPLPVLVEIRDALAEAPAAARYDLVIGNPPYGRVKLSDPQRKLFSRSLYGHANRYGLFTDQALRHTRPGGIIAFVTPTSFLAGQYFKNLRGLLAREAPPLQIDFVAARTGVFEDVLQETALTICRKGLQAGEGTTSVLQVSAYDRLEVSPTGVFQLPENGSDPWIIARSSDQMDLVRQMAFMPYRLRDYRYRVSTGPLVWNRHKQQLRSALGKDCYPLIWAEAVTNDGRFIFRADKKNHQPYFQTRPGQDEWLKIYRPCVLLQRTTAKEQQRRLIAAALPAAFIQAHQAVIVENHLNMIVPTVEALLLSPKTIARLLNSRIVDQAFRCINGSVAISAYELETLPLPSPQVLFGIERLIQEGATDDLIEQRIEESYRNARTATAA